MIWSPPEFNQAPGPCRHDVGLDLFQALVLLLTCCSVAPEKSLSLPGVVSGSMTIEILSS